MLCGCFSLNGRFERRRACAYGTSVCLTAVFFTEQDQVCVFCVLVFCIGLSSSVLRRSGVVCANECGRWSVQRSCCLIRDMSLEMEMFPFYSFIASRRREETDSYGCLKERDKENRKEERRKTRSVRERGGEWVCQGGWIQTRCKLSMEMFIDWLTLKGMKCLFPFSLVQKWLRSEQRMRKGCWNPKENICEAERGDGFHL